MKALHPQLARLAREHDGIVTRTHAVARHVSPNVLRAAARDGALHRVRAGLFVLAERWQAAQLHERYTLTVRGVLLGHPDWVASHHAALALHGLALFDVDLSRVDVVAAVRASKIRPDLHVHVASADQLASAAAQEVRVVSPADACVLTAAASGFEAGVVAMDAALHRRLVTREGLEVAASTLPGARYGIGTVRAAIEAADARCESPGESRTRLILHEAGLDVRSQVTIDEDGPVGRVDFLVGQHVVVEFDGLVKYDGADGKLALAREKTREDRLRAAGFRVVRLTWADLAHPNRVVNRVRRELAAAA